MRNYFDITEFLIDMDSGMVPIHVVQKINKYHKPILNNIRAQIGSPLIISQHSGYRPVQWEKEHGRDGTSQHCFGENKPARQRDKHRGAVDVTCKESALHHLGDLLAESDYARVAWYPDDDFYHCDFKDYQLGKRLYVVQNGIWKQKDYRSL